jgi:hypothetical protein
MFGGGNLTAFEDTNKPVIAWNLYQEVSVLEMVASPNDVLFTLSTISLTSFNLSAINISSSEFMYKNLINEKFTFSSWTDVIVNTSNWFDFIALDNGNLIVNVGKGFFIYEERTGKVLLNKENYVVGGASSEFLYAFNVTGQNGRFTSFSNAVVKMDLEGNVAQLFPLPVVSTSLRV